MMTNVGSTTRLYYISKSMLYEVTVVTKGQQCALIESIINFDSFIAKFFKNRIPGPPSAPCSRNSLRRQ